MIIFKVTTTTIPTTTTTTPTTTTTDQTLPPGCVSGSLDARVCEIEDAIEEFHENFQGIKDDKEEMKESLENQNALIAEIMDENQRQKIIIEELQSSLKNKTDNFSAALEELQNQVLILTTRPCSCN